MPAVRARVRAAARVFSGGSDLARDPVLREYLTDLARPYGVALRERTLTAGSGHSYGEMGEALIGDLVTEDDPVDLLILAHAIPDVRPGRSTALYLSSVCPGRPEAFAITDQGPTAPYTAFRLAATFLGSAQCRNAVIVIVEQTELYHDPLVDEGASAPELPDCHAGVAVRIEPGAARVYQHTSVDRDEAGRLLAERLDLHSGAERPVIILGGGMAGWALDGVVDSEVLRPKGQPTTGVWAAYARRPGTALLADYDADIRTLSICMLDTRGTAA